MEGSPKQYILDENSKAPLLPEPEEALGWDYPKKKNKKTRRSNVIFLVFSAQTRYSCILCTYFLSYFVTFTPVTDKKLEEKLWGFRNMNFSLIIYPFLTPENLCMGHFLEYFVFLFISFTAAIIRNR